MKYLFRFIGFIIFSFFIFQSSFAGEWNSEQLTESNKKESSRYPRMDMDNAGPFVPTIIHRRSDLFGREGDVWIRLLSLKGTGGCDSQNQFWCRSELSHFIPPCDDGGNGVTVLFKFISIRMP